MVDTVVRWGVLGLIVGAIVASTLQSGYLEAWEQLPPAPAQVRRLLGEYSGGIYVRGVDYALCSCESGPGQCVVGDIVGTFGPGSYIQAVDSAVYRCSSPQIACWQAELYAPALGDDGYAISPTCPLRLRAAWRLAHRLAPVAQCVVSSRPAVDGTIRVGLLLDRQGTVWRWDGSQAFVGQSFVWCMVVLFVTGGCVGLGLLRAGARWLGDLRRVPDAPEP